MKLRLRQTAGGMYSSFPRADDVLALMAGDRDWEEEYASCGHGEYIDNVHEVAKAAASLGPTAEERAKVVSRLLETAEVDVA